LLRKAVHNPGDSRRGYDILSRSLTAPDAHITHVVVIMPVTDMKWRANDLSQLTDLVNE
jgi:hypothetical protein